MDKTLGSARHEALIELLIKKREAAGLSQDELAKRLGEYQSFVARLESGQRRVDVVELISSASRSTSIQQKSCARCAKSANQLAVAAGVRGEKIGRNAVEIEEAVTELAEKPFDTKEFPY